MAQIMTKITLDVSVSGSGVTVMAKQGDSASRYLTARLTDNGAAIDVLPTSSVLLNARRADGEARSFAGQVNGDGSVTVPITAWMLHNAGAIACDISVVDVAAHKLTSTRFEVFAEPAVCPDGGMGEDESSISARILAEERLNVLEPYDDDGSYYLLPEVNRKYSVDLSNGSYYPDGVWLPITVELPTPANTDFDTWILLYFHAVRGGASSYFTPSFHAEEEIEYLEGTLPDPKSDDFTVIANYLPSAQKWQIGALAYKPEAG